LSMRLIRLAVFTLFAVTLQAQQTEAGVLFASSYAADIVFDDALGTTTMTMAHDGSSYWSTTGGSPTGTRLAQYNASGVLQTTYAPGLDFRSVFTDAGGNIYARTVVNRTIYRMTSPGVFSSLLSLSGGPLDVQSSVVFNGDGTEFIAMGAGVVSRWDLTGTFLGTVALAGYGLSGESSYPQNRGIAAVGDYWLTYSNGTLSAWNSAGSRVDQTTLTGAGTSFDSHFSLSYANGHVFVIDVANGNWRGFDVGLNDASPTPEPASMALLAMGGGLLAFGRKKLSRRRQPADVAA
jgi:hypothetical protein